MSISGMGYLGLGVNDLGAWEKFATGILGLQIGERTDDGRVLLRMDDCRYRIALHQDAADDIAYVGWEVADADALDAVVSRLGEAGVAVTPGTQALADARGVTALASFNDPNGLKSEVFFGPSMRFETPFRSPLPISGFVTGEQGLGHMVMFVKDLEQSLHFYQRALGFRISDFIELKFGPGMKFTLAFLHCNPRHHSLAIGAVPMSPKRLNHIMLQLQSFDDVGQAIYRAQENDVEIAATLGRHTNDHMVSFYMKTPSGFDIEYGWGARVVDDATWHVQRHEAPSIWGHQRKGFAMPSAKSSRAG